MYLILDMDSGLLDHDSDSVSPPEGLHIMAALTSRPTSTGASRCLHLDGEERADCFA